MKCILAWLIIVSCDALKRLQGRVDKKKRFMDMLEALCNDELPDYGSRELFGSGVFSCKKEIAESGAFGRFVGATFFEKYYRIPHDLHNISNALRNEDARFPRRTMMPFILHSGCPEFPLDNFTLESFDWNQCSTELPSLEVSENTVAFKYSDNEQQRDFRRFRSESNAFRAARPKGFRTDEEGNTYNIFPYVLDPKFDDHDHTDNFHSRYFIMQYLNGHAPNKFNEYLPYYPLALFSGDENAVEKFLQDRWHFFSALTSVVDFLLYVVPKTLWEHGLAHCDLHIANILIEDSDTLIKDADCKTLRFYKRSKPIRGYTCLAERQTRFIDLTYFIDTNLACQGDQHRLSLPCNRCVPFSHRMEDIGEILKHPLRKIRDDRKKVEAYFSDSSAENLKSEHAEVLGKQKKFSDDFMSKVLDQTYPPMEQCLRALEIWDTRQRTKEQQAKLLEINAQTDRNCSLAAQIDLAKYLRAKLKELRTEYSAYLEDPGVLKDPADKENDWFLDEFE